MVKKSFQLIIISIFLSLVFDSLTAHAADELDCLKVVAAKVEEVPTPRVEKALVKETEEQVIGKTLSLLFEVESAVPDTTSAILGERLPFNSLLLTDPTQNLAVRSPFVVMNAAQRMLAVIYSQGKETIRHKLTNEEVTKYPFFSSGLPVTRGARIISNEKPISEFVNNLKAQAAGDRTGSVVILLVANAGTGKTETLRILGIGAESLTSQPTPEYASYTYDWTNLSDITSLHRFLPPTTIEGVAKIPDLEAPMGDSPFTLLPPEYQKLVANNARPVVEKLLDGMAPTPFTTPDPVSNFIRNEIIRHYSLKRGHVLSPKEIVEVLGGHVSIKRQILGQTYGRMPLIDAQGNDIDVQGLFMSPNPVVRFASGVGPTHVMAWYLNGKILQGHGNAVMFDELFRNPQDLLDMLLGAFESRRLSVGGAPTVPFDAVMIAATNTASLDKVLEDGKKGGKEKQSTNMAAVDRLRVTPMRWDVDPVQVARLLLYNKQSGLKQQSLTQEDAPVTDGKIDELVPNGMGLTKAQTPDGRYRLWFGEGSQKVEVSPHTLMLMAEVIAATRMETSPEKASQVYSGKIVHSTIFRSPIDRLRLYEGLMPDIQISETKELDEVGKLLKQGETGISSRDAGKWLTESIEAAKSNKTGWTLTPGVVLKKFREMLVEGSIVSPSHLVRIKWQEIAKEVTTQLLITRLDADMSRAQANGDQVVKMAYFDLIDEMYAIHQNEDAMFFTSSTTNQERPINRERLGKIKEIYLKLNGRPLSAPQIAIFHSRQSLVSPVGAVPEEALLEAVSQYYAKLNEQVAGFASVVDFERTGVGSDETRSVHASLVNALKAMGYNEVAIRDAMMLIEDQRSRDRANDPR